MSDAQATMYEVRQGAAWITLNRPQNRNALSAGLVNELHQHLLAAREDPHVRCIVLTGNGPAFCAGADLKDPPGESTDGGPAWGYPDILKLMLNSPKPVITAVNGAAFAGGIGLLGAADIVITDEAAQFSFSEVRIGVIPAIISVVCLPKLGKHLGMKLFLTGERFDGNQAVAYGLAHQAVPAGQLHAAVQEQIDLIRLGGPNAIAECKRLVQRIPELSLEDGFTEAAGWSARLFSSDEGSEGMAAFRDKRNPAWVDADPTA